MPLKGSKDFYGRSSENFFGNYCPAVRRSIASYYGQRQPEEIFGKGLKRGHRLRTKILIAQAKRSKVRKTSGRRK